MKTCYACRQPILPSEQRELRRFNRVLMDVHQVCPPKAIDDKRYDGAYADDEDDDCETPERAKVLAEINEACKAAQRRRNLMILFLKDLEKNGRLGFCPATHCLVDTRKVINAVPIPYISFATEDSNPYLFQPF